MKNAFNVKPKLSVKAGRDMVLLSAVFVMTMAGAAEVVLNDIRNVTGYTSYTSADVITGTGGFCIKDGAEAVYVRKNNRWVPFGSAYL